MSTDRVRFKLPPRDDERRRHYFSCRPSIETARNIACTELHKLVEFPVQNTRLDCASVKRRADAGRLSTPRSLQAGEQIFGKEIRAIGQTSRGHEVSFAGFPRLGDEVQHLTFHDLLLWRERAVADRVQVAIGAVQSFANLRFVIAPLILAKYL